MSAQRYMLDTNIVSELVRRPSGKCAMKVRQVGAEYLCVSIVTASELRFGARKRGSPQLEQRIDAILAALDVVPLDRPTDEEYARIRHDLEIKGNLIGPNDLLIAAHACALDAILVTANLREFSRVGGLNTENWMT